MRPVSPNTGAPEIDLGEGQHQYLNLACAVYSVDPSSGGRPMVTAWVPKTDELQMMAATLLEQLGTTPIVLSESHAMRLLAAVFKAHPVFVKQLTFRGFTPMMVSAGPEPWMLVGDRAPTG